MARLQQRHRHDRPSPSGQADEGGARRGVVMGTIGRATLPKWSSGDDGERRVLISSDRRTSGTSMHERPGYPARVVVVRQPAGCVRSRARRRRASPRWSFRSSVSGSVAFEDDSLEVLGALGERTACGFMRVLHAALPRRSRTASSTSIRRCPRVPGDARAQPLAAGDGHRHRAGHPPRRGAGAPGRRRESPRSASWPSAPIYKQALRWAAEDGSTSRKDLSRRFGLAIEPGFADEDVVR
jgi:hypothetical protein